MAGSKLDWASLAGGGPMIGRRGFMAGAAAVGALAVSGVRPAFAEPARGGHIRFGMADGASSDTLDPAAITNSYMDFVNHGFRSFLAEVRADGTLGPELAQSWEGSDGAKRWVFDLVPGVTFHNGKSLTAADVVATLRYHLDENSKSGGKALLDGVVDVKADGDHRVIVQLGDGNADFPYLLTDYHFGILPANADGKVDWSAKDSGTGGYLIESFEPGVATVFKRNPNFFRSDRAFVDSAEVLLIADPTARNNALIGSEIDVLHDLKPNLVKLIGQRPGITIHSIPSGSHCTLPMRGGAAPFDNADFRMAMKYGINREEIIEKVLSGQGTVGNDHPIGPTIPFWADLPQRPYDPDKAKFHLKKAGMDAASVELFTSDTAFAGATDTCLLYKAQAAPAGVDITVTRSPEDGYWSDVWNKKPFCITLWVARPVPDMIFSTAYRSGADWNESQFSNQRFDQLLLAARSELDTAKRADFYREMQQIVSDEGNTIVPFFQNHVFATRDPVKVGAISAAAPLDGNRALERWWVA